MVPEEAPAFAGCFGIVLMIGVIAGYVIFLIAVWRLMRAHESIAATLGRTMGAGPLQAPGMPPAPSQFR